MRKLPVIVVLPAVSNTARFAIPPTPTETFPPELTIVTLLVPDAILEAVPDATPVNWLPLPRKKLPVTLPLALKLVPVITPPTTDAPVTVPVTLALVPVITPPTTDAPVTVPLALNVVVKMLPVNAVVTFQAVVDEL